LEPPFAAAAAGASSANAIGAIKQSTERTRIIATTVFFMILIPPFLKFKY
jgi:hypothetical protein